MDTLYSIFVCAYIYICILYATKSIYPSICRFTDIRIVRVASSELVLRGLSHPLSRWHSDRAIGPGSVAARDELWPPARRTAHNRECISRLYMSSCQNCGPFVGVHIQGDVDIDVDIDTGS